MQSYTYKTSCEHHPFSSSSYPFSPPLSFLLQVPFGVPFWNELLAAPSLLETLQMDASSENPVMAHFGERMSKWIDRWEDRSSSLLRKERCRWRMGVCVGGYGWMRPIDGFEMRRRDSGRDWGEVKCMYVADLCTHVCIYVYIQCHVTYDPVTFSSCSNILSIV